MLTQGPEEPNTAGVLPHAQQAPRRVCPEIQPLLFILFGTAERCSSEFALQNLAPSARFCNALLKWSLTSLEFARPARQSGRNELQVGNRFSFLKEPDSKTLLHGAFARLARATERGKSAVLTWGPSARVRRRVQQHQGSAVAAFTGG